MWPPRGRRRPWPGAPASDDLHATSPWWGQDLRARPPCARGRRRRATRRSAGQSQGRRPRSRLAGYPEAMLGRREAALAHVLGIGGGRLADGRAQIGIASDEFRAEVSEEAGDILG